MAHIFLFIIVVFAAAYVQTVTGFAFGLVFMGLIGLTGLISVEDAAVVVSIATIVNAFVVLVRGWRCVNLRYLGLTLLGAIPCVLVGYSILEWLAGSSLLLLEMLLGLVIIASSFQLLFQPKPLNHVSHGWTFTLFGTFGGLLSGLFSSAGPPIVYHFYRQPIAYPVIRETLLALFTCTGFMRLGTVVVTGGWHISILWWSLLSCPIVIIATILARRYPPKLNPNGIRRVVFVLLFLSGLSLGLPAALTMIFG